MATKYLPPQIHFVASRYPKSIFLHLKGGVGRKMLQDSWLLF